ncbi:5360_t:CDS:1 [Racocetra fulgida]|uniref:5360_t:CDS:1 n=1 Tax=Racocetra fulgida TaxID=60492 RepID=A0A9N8VTV4_9GLOM|nr:5360_t:CDS:1 [Racocetra fulgida]
MRRWEKWIDKGKGGFTKKGNLKRASYELVREWVSETWREFSPNLLAKSFEAAGLMLNPDGSEDDKMSSRLQAVVADRMNEVSFSEKEDNQGGIDSESDPDDDNESNQDDNNESNPDDELDTENVLDCDPEDMMDIYDSGDMIDMDIYD